MWPRRTPTRAEMLKQARQDPTSLGNILVKKGYLTKDQLETAVTQQMRETPHLGEVLIRLGFITQQQCEDALFEQKVLRGEISDRDLLKHRMHQQTEALKGVSLRFGEVKELSNALVAKASMKK